MKTTLVYLLSFTVLMVCSCTSLKLNKIDINGDQFFVDVPRSYSLSKRSDHEFLIFSPENVEDSILILGVKDTVSIKKLLQFELVDFTNTKLSEIHKSITETHEGFVEEYILDFSSKPVHHLVIWNFMDFDNKQVIFLRKGNSFFTQKQKKTFFKLALSLRKDKTQFKPKSQL